MNPQKQKEFNLSEKRKRLYNFLIDNYLDKLGQGIINRIIQQIKDQDKEFIKRLKEEDMKMMMEFADYIYGLSPHNFDRYKKQGFGMEIVINNKFNKLAGEKLI